MISIGKIGKINCLVSALIILGCSVALNIGFAQDFPTMDQSVIEDFYNGLADIIEANMNDPDRALDEVENYYQANSSAVEMMRNATQVGMQMAMQQMDKYEGMSEKELNALDRQYGGYDENKMEQMRQDKMSSGMRRYSQVTQSFTEKHPGHAMKFANIQMKHLMSGGSMSSRFGY